VDAEEVIGKMRESEAAIRSVECKFRFFEPETNSPWKVSGKWCRQGAGEFLDEFTTFRDGNTYGQLSAYDGQMVRHLSRQSDGSIQGTFRKHCDPEVFTIPDTPRRLLGWSLDTSRNCRLGELLSDKSVIEKRAEPAQLAGGECILLEVRLSPGGNEKIWVDPQRDYRPVRIETYVDSVKPWFEPRWIKRRLNLWSTTDIELQEIGGVWFPVAGNIQHYPRPRLFALRKPRPVRRMEVTEITLNRDIPPEQFTVRYPEGCLVYDGIEQDRFVADKNGQRPVIEEESVLNEPFAVTMEPEQRVKAYIDILRNFKVFENKRRWFAAIRGLMEAGSAAVGPLAEELKQTRRGSTQSAMAFTLRAIGDPDAIPALIDALEQSSGCCDCGLGKDTSALGRFMRRHQISPVDEDIGFGRPVREITAALERLSGHTEGDEHFYSYDARGKKLQCSYHLTPEIVERDRQVRKKVADRWRSWYQKKVAENKRTRFGSCCEQVHLEMEFHIVPNIGEGSAKPCVSPAELSQCLDDIAGNGPLAGCVEGRDHQWYRVKDGLELDGLPTAVFKEKTYLLICARQQYSIWPTDEGRRHWQLKKVAVTKDELGRPAINAILDRHAGRLLARLAEGNIGNWLAISLDGDVICVKRIKSVCGREVILDPGIWTEETARQTADRIREANRSWGYLPGFLNAFRRR
jgi:hypothetical protein